MSKPPSVEPLNAIINTGSRFNTWRSVIVICAAVVAAVIVRVSWEQHAGNHAPPRQTQPAMDDSAAEIPLNPPPLPFDNADQLSKERSRVDSLTSETTAASQQQAAEAAMHMGDLWRAESIAKMILARTSRNPLARLTLAASLRMQGNTDGAMPIYLQLLKEDSRDTDAYLGLADTAFASNNRPQTYAWLKRGVNEGAQTARALTAIAHRYQDWKDFPNAELAANRAVKISPDNVDGLLELASIQVQSNRLDAGFQTLESVFKKDSANEFAYRLMGVVLMNPAYSHRDINRARTLLEQAVGLDVKDADIYRSVAVIYREQHLYRLAAQAYDALLHLQPASADARYGLGQVYALLGKPELSKQQLALYALLDDRNHRAVRLNEEAAHQPQNGEIQIEIAHLMESSGDFAAALPHYQKAATLEPRNKAVQADLDRFYAHLGWPPPKHNTQ